MWMIWPGFSLLFIVKSETKERNWGKELISKKGSALDDLGSPQTVKNLPAI